MEDIRNILSVTAIVVCVLWAAEKAYNKGVSDGMKMRKENG